MKIVRLKKGYRITLSDSEFDLISGLVDDGIMTYRGDDSAYEAYISAAQKSAWTRREKGGPLMRVDEDRRALPSHQGAE